jgi:DNA-binding PadR family transcriptional regulator
MLSEDAPEILGFRYKVLLAFGDLGATRDAPVAGAEIMEHLETTDSYRLDDIYPGRLYPHFDELTEIGLVKKRDDAGRRSNDYHLTDEGIEYLRSWMDYHNQVAKKLGAISLGTEAE